MSNMDKQPKMQQIPEQMDLDFSQELKEKTDTRKLEDLSEKEINELRDSIFAKHKTGDRLTDLERQLEEKEIEESKEDGWYK